MWHICFLGGGVYNTFLAFFALGLIFRVSHQVPSTLRHDDRPPYFLLQHVGDGECSVFVKVHTSTDRWARAGWCFESLCDDEGNTEPVLERVTPPHRQVLFLLLMMIILK